MALSVSDNGSAGDAFDAPALFQTYIARTAAGALTQLQAAGDALPPVEHRDLALNTLDFALKLPAAWPQTSDLLVVLAPKMEQAGSRLEWMHILEEGIRSSQEQGDLSTESELRLQQGILHQLLGEYEQACEQYERSESGFAALNDAHGRARVWNRRAYVLRRQREWAEATRYAHLALEAVAEGDPERGYSLLVLGLIAFDQRYWADAVHFLAQSLQQFEAGGNKRYQAWSHTNLGLALWQMNDLAAAEAHLIDAISLFDTIDDPVNRAVAQMNLGNVYMALDRPQEALTRYLDAEIIFRKAGERLRQATIYRNIGKAYHALKRLGDAEGAAIRGLELLSAVNRPADHINAMESLGEIYVDAGQHQQAVDVLQKAIELLPQVENSEYRDRLEQRLVADLQTAVAGMTEK